MADNNETRPDAYLNGYTEELQEQIRNDWHATDVRLGEIIRTWFDKCCQSLGVLNAGALIAILSLGSSLLGKDKPIDVSPLEFAAYAYAGGLLCVAIAVGVTVVMLDRYSSYHSKIARQMLDNQIMVGAAWEKVADAVDTSGTIFRIVQGGLIVGSFIFFFIGVYRSLDGIEVIQQAVLKASVSKAADISKPPVPVILPASP